MLRAMRKIFLTLIGLLAAASTAYAASAPSVDMPWIRYVPGGQNAAAYLSITSAVDDTLASVTSECCDRVEIHEMTMDGNAMRMREVDDVKLAAGTPITFAPMGYHLMLFGLKNAPTQGDIISIELTYGSGTTDLVPFTVELVGHDAHGGHH